MTARKSKITALILLLIVVSALFAMPADAAEVFFTVINDKEPEALNSLTMPVKINGVVYVPYTIFLEKDLLGTNGFSSNRTAVIWRDRIYLEFNTLKNTTYDQDKNEKSYKAVYRNSAIYVPVANVCDFFGLTWSEIEIPDLGTVIRIKNEYVLEDNIYINAASGYMQQELAKYLKSSEMQGTPSPQVSGTPYDKRDVDVFISIYGYDSDRVDEILWKLDMKNIKGCFFVTASDIKENRDQIQRILGTGHHIGLYLGEDIAGEYIEASEYLRGATESKTILVALKGAMTDETKALADEMGLVIWFDDSCEKYSAENGFKISKLQNILRKSENRVDLILKADEEVTSGLDSILNELAEGGFRVKRVRETETTCIEFNAGRT